ncbi:hypothetical protein XENOCAPTIV_024325 [Xenoophorus captivus]|uniref:HMG box domain-containing protein n=1 Tax=Xenoophorus captivus TaxID=1517983 RepID=A0ABV0RWN7_9TELE
MNGFSDEDFNIPPITPPTLPDHILPPHLPHDASPRPYQPMEPLPSLAAHHPYQLQGMDLPGIPVSQDGAAGLNQDGETFSPDGGPMTSTLSVVRSCCFGLLMGDLEINYMLWRFIVKLMRSSICPPVCTLYKPQSISVATSQGEKRPAAVDISKKPKTPKKKKRKDPNEPVKPVSAYALFFRDTQANIKAQNPNATFGEVSKIVASMWDGLGEEQKQVELEH